MKIKTSVYEGIMILRMTIIIVALTVMIFNVSKASPTPTHIVINELYFDYQILQEPTQWVEIYNPTENSVDISAWILAFTLIDGVNIFPSNTVIAPGEYLIVTHDKQAFEAQFTVPTGTQVIDDNDMLDNFVGPEIDTLELISDTNIVVDHLYYGGVSGSAPFVAPPSSVARYKGGYDTDQCSKDFYVELIPTPGKESVREYIEGVGGIWVPVDKIGLLAPYIGVTSTILVTTVATAICVKRVKRGKEKQ